MKKLIICLSILLFLSKNVLAAEPIEGFWTTIDDETNTAKSIVRVYEHNGKYFARVVDLFANREATAAIDGNPKIIGLDIAWNLQKDGDKFSGGKILDPKKGKVYGCEMWRDGENLIVRGKIAFLGRNQTWLPHAALTSDERPVPHIPVAAK